jgi:hypothetical protein
MMSDIDLVQGAKHALGISTDRALADHYGVHVSQIGRWKSGSISKVYQGLLKQLIDLKAVVEMEADEIS